MLIEKDLVESRSKAQALIMAGKVCVGGQVVTKVGMQVSTEADVTIKSELPYVSRGGVKLVAALDSFKVDPGGTVCADVGASTGGFTDVLLQHGAKGVYAIDVGYGQLAWKLRQDKRVTVMERTNARYLNELPEPVNLVVIDTSFISLKFIFPAVLKWLAAPGQIIALVKPQFEAGKAQVGRGGVVRDVEVHRQVLHRVVTYAEQCDLVPLGLIVSPLTGPAGNYEFLLYLGWHMDLPSLVVPQAIEACVAPLSY